MRLRHPTPDDGLAVWRLVRDTGVLDLNSSYAYCAHFRHFGAASVVAVADDDTIVGFITGYLLPDRSDVLFVWQVGVSEAARGQGLASRMLRWLIDAAPQARWLETTVTPDNAPSRGMFRKLARTLEADCQVGPGFSAQQLGADHEPEELFRIGPFSRSTS